MRKAVAALGVLLALAAASPFALAWYASEQILRSRWYEHRTPEQGLRPTRWHDADADPRTELGLDFEDVEFSAIDGSTLRGWFVPISSPISSAPCENESLGCRRLTDRALSGERPNAGSILAPRLAATSRRAVLSEDA